MNATEAVAVLRAHNEWRRAEAPEIPDGIPDTSPPHSARDIGIAIDVLCDEIKRLHFERDAFKAASDARARILEDVALTGEMLPNSELRRVGAGEQNDE